MYFTHAKCNVINRKWTQSARGKSIFYPKCNFKLSLPIEFLLTRANETGQSVGQIGCTESSFCNCNEETLALQLSSRTFSQ